MSLASREDILGAQDWETKDVTCRWGKLRIRSLSANEYLDLSARSKAVKDNREALLLQARIVALALVDDQGNRLFTDDEHEILLSRDWPTLEFVAKEVMSHNGLGDDAAEETEKN